MALQWITQLPRGFLNPDLEYGSYNTQIEQIEENKPRRGGDLLLQNLRMTGVRVILVLLYLALLGEVL